MTKLYHQEGAWLVPGHQDRKATRVDVPSSPIDLAAWLNQRRVPAIAAELELEEQPAAADQERPWELGPATKEPPRYEPKFNRDWGEAEFVPIAKSAAIAASYGACPKCQRTWAAQVIAGISSAPIDELQLIMDAIGRRMREDHELEQESAI